MNKRIIIVGILFAVGIIVGLSVGNEGISSNGRLVYAAGTFLGWAFIFMGLYSLLSGRVYGRTWEKYWGGWVFKTENPGYYWSYTFMYLFAGPLVIFGCRLIL